MQQQTITEKPSQPPPPQLAPVDIFLTHVPANLRAKFGRARCRELLADEAGVQRAWSRLLAESAPSPTTSYHGNRDQVQQQQRRPPQRLPPLRQQQQQQDWYAILSEQFNSDYAPGVAAPRHLGHNHETHGEAVFQRAGVYNDAGDLHKRRRDEFVAYNEIIHVERKFNAQWAKEASAAAADASRLTQPQRQPPPPPPRAATQPPPTSIILSGGGGASSSSKRVTIHEGDQEPQGGQSLHRANTVRREA